MLRHILVPPLLCWMATKYSSFLIFLMRSCCFLWQNRFEKKNCLKDQTLSRLLLHLYRSCWLILILETPKKTFIGTCQVTFIVKLLQSIQLYSYCICIPMLMYKLHTSDHLWRTCIQILNLCQAIFGLWSILQV